MKSLLHATGAIGICLVFTMTTSSCGDDSVARAIASAILKNQAVQYLKDWKSEFKLPACEAVAEAVEPEKHVRVSIREFTLLPHSVVLSASVESRFAIRGKLTKDDQDVAFTAEADVGLLISVVARLQENNDEILVRPKVKDIEFEVTILEVKPSDLPGGKDRVKELTDSGLKSCRDRLLREINDWLARRRITSD